LLALRAVYPEYHWQEQGNHLPQGYWNSLQNQRQFFDSLAKKFNIQKPEDWYKITVDEVVHNGGSFIQRHYKGSLLRGTNLTM
jgi:hypothetical protein